jgi:hypothetical protein
MEPLVAEIERSFAEIERQLGDPELIAAISSCRAPMSWRSGGVR